MADITIHVKPVIIPVDYGQKEIAVGDARFDEHDDSILYVDVYVPRTMLGEDEILEELKQSDGC